MKIYSDSRRNARVSTINIGDLVLVRQAKRNKLSSPYDPAPLTVIGVKGSMVTAKRKNQVITRNTSFFKKIGPDVSDFTEPNEETEFDLFDDEREVQVTRPQNNSPQYRRSTRTRRQPNFYIKPQNMFS